MPRHSPIRSGPSNTRDSRPFAACIASAVCASERRLAACPGPNAHSTSLALERSSPGDSLVAIVNVTVIVLPTTVTAPPCTATASVGVTPSTVYDVM